MRDAVRNSVLAVLAIVAVWVARTRQTAPGGQCVKSGPCGGCLRVTRCDLPQARAVRRAQTGG